MTSRVRLGLMVGANTFRNPGLTAKLATTLDHVSDGRAVLGIGGAWFEREHDAFGIEFGASPGERLGWLDESVMLHAPPARRRAVSRTTARATRCTTRLRAAPVQPHLPILIGGSGRQKTLRIVAERADGWNTVGLDRRGARRPRDARAHCDDVGRDIATIEKTISFPIVLRDDAGGRDATGSRELLDHERRARSTTSTATSPGSPGQIADAIRPYLELGFETVIVRMPAPTTAKPSSGCPRSRRGSSPDLPP